MKVNILYWFEVFISNEEEGSKTIDTFDTEQEAKDFINEIKYLEEYEGFDIDYDKWRTNECGINQKVTE